MKTEYQNKAGTTKKAKPLNEDEKRRLDLFNKKNGKRKSVNRVDR